MTRRIENRFRTEPRFDNSSVENQIRRLESSVTNIEQTVNGTQFLNVTEFDDTDASHYYYGGVDAEGDWKINRYDKVALARESADQASNPTKTSLSSAWTDRLTLTYS